MITVEDLRPGDIMFGPIGGIVPGVLPVGLGQLLLAPRKDRLTWRRWWRVRHVGMVVEASEHHQGPTVRYVDGTYRRAAYRRTTIYLPPGAIAYPTGVITEPRLVQAMPSGAEEIDMRTEKHWTSRHVYVRPAWQFSEQAGIAAGKAIGYVGTPYGFLTYAALALHAIDPVWRIAPEATGSQPLARYIRSTDTMICSQLVDQALTDAGFHVFDDGRLPQDVVPAELFRQLIAMPGTQYVVPGMPAWAEAPPYWR